MILLSITIPWAIIKIVILVILGVYEVIARLVPSIKDWTILGNIIALLQKLSDFLNVLKSKK